MRYPFRSLPENLAAFCAMLRREHRFLIGPNELLDAAHALELTPIGDERAVRNTLRTVLSASLDDVRAFDAAFVRFFRGARGDEPAHHALPSARTGDARAARDADLHSQDRGANSEATNDSRADAEASRGAITDLTEEKPELLRTNYSALDGEAALPDLGPADAAWREAAATLVSRVRAGLSRRWRPAASGQRFDLRRTLRRSLPGGGDMLMPRWRERRLRRPRFVLFVDGSRSMTPYASPALQTAVALSSVALDTETFAFSTSLRRMTSDVRRAAAGARPRLHLHHAWGGGTAIGPCLREFVSRFGSRLLGADTVVMIWSDGLDVASTEVLRDAMASLSRRSAAIVWLNPLIETPGYQPTAVAMTTARPFVTTLASVTDPAGLIRLSRVMRIR